ncbi:MAG: type VI secretion system baseplate subunit TssE [Alphaproteobacteria bacterium]|nr:type VI secretion system baseplate subunit TssE [Alphaproteobacteria bacterium]
MENVVTAPLFERLVDENTDVPFEKNPKRYLPLSELQEVILKDLSNLLNTRVAIFWQNYVSKITVPYAYGVNATCTVSAENVFEIQELESRIDKVIQQFEPRLINARTHVVGTGTDPSTLFINIDAEIIFEGHKTPLTFPVVVDM